MEGPEQNQDDDDVLETEEIIKKRRKESRSAVSLTSSWIWTACKTHSRVGLLYLRGQDGWRHLIAKVGLGRDLGMGATSALCYAAATHHRVYILSREGKDKEPLFSS